VRASLAIERQLSGRVFNYAACPQSAWLPTVEILPPGIGPTMIDATRNQVVEVNGD
jgi:hypothetical protein